MTFCHGLKLTAPDGKLRETDCANTEDIFRIIQSIPSPKAEPFKRWPAKVGYERVQEIEDPEPATKRTRAIYKAKGYSDAWIEKRMRGIAIREELTRSPVSGASLLLKMGLHVSCISPFPAFKLLQCYNLHQLRICGIFKALHGGKR